MYVVYLNLRLSSVNQKHLGVLVFPHKYFPILVWPQKTAGDYRSPVGKRKEGRSYHNLELNKHIATKLIKPQKPYKKQSSDVPKGNYSFQEQKTEKKRRNI